MFARDRTANFHAQQQNALAEFFRALQFTRLVGIKQDQRMQIAVSGVEHIRDWQSIFL